MTPATWRTIFLTAVAALVVAATQFVSETGAFHSVVIGEPPVDVDA